MNCATLSYKFCLLLSRGELLVSLNPSIMKRPQKLPLPTMENCFARLFGLRMFSMESGVGAVANV